MNIRFDIKTSDGKLYEDCTIKHYIKNIRGGKDNIVLSHASDSLRVFNKDNVEIKGINLPNAKIVKAFDIDNNIDITDKLQYISQPSFLFEKLYVD